jgi:hypothetical protein
MSKVVSEAKQHTVFVPHKRYSLNKQEAVFSALSEEVKKVYALKLLRGLVTLPELVKRFGPEMGEAIMKRSYRFDPDHIPEAHPHQTTKIPHPLLKRIPQVLEAYWSKSRTDEDEQAYLDILEQLKKDRRFLDILEQYQPLIVEYPERTEQYESNAMKIFIEMRPGVI